MGATTTKGTARISNDVGALLASVLPDLRRRARSLARGDEALAEDVVQDAVERALRFKDHYEAGTNFRAWAMQIVFSVYVTRYRRLRRERVALSSLEGDPCAWTRPAAFDDAQPGLTTTTRARLDALPGGFRDAIVLVDLGDRTYRDAAKELGVPVGTVMSRLHRGRKLLAESMREAA